LEGNQDEVQQLQAENQHLRIRVQELEVENALVVEQLQAMPVASPRLSREQLHSLRDRILENLRQGKGRGRGSGAIASTSPQYKTAVKALDQFVAEICSALEVAPIEDSTPLSTPVSTPDSRTNARIGQALGDSP